MSNRIDNYIRETIPVGWMMCSCGERRECPRDCEKFIAFLKRSEDYFTKMFEDFVSHT